jgi:hypothetical protein
MNTSTMGASAPLWLRCAWCGRYDDGGGEWVSFAPRDRPPIDQTTHGICPGCLEAQYIAAAERRARNDSARRT